MLVRAITPVRNGDREPRAPGDEFEIDARDAFELSELGAVEVIDPDWNELASDRPGDTRENIQGVALPGESANGATDEMSQVRADLAAARAELERGDNLLAAAKVEVEQLRQERDVARGEAAELRKLMDGAAGEILQLRGQIESLSAARPAAPPTVSTEMKLDALRKVAADEGVAFDANDTKAELVGKIEAGRKTAQAEG